MAEDRNAIQRLLDQVEEARVSARDYVGLPAGGKGSIFDGLLIIPNFIRHVAHDISVRWAETAPDKPILSAPLPSYRCDDASQPVAPSPTPAGNAKRNKVALGG